MHSDRMLNTNNLNCSWVVHYFPNLHSRNSKLVPSQFNSNIGWKLGADLHRTYYEYYEAESSSLRPPFSLWQCFVVRRCTLVCAPGHVLGTTNASAILILGIHRPSSSGPLYLHVVQ
jgi:hypothetical protein